MFCNCDIPECTCIQDAIDTLPKYFGLRGFPGDTFWVNKSQSWNDSGTPVLYMFCGKLAFSKGSAANIQKEISHTFLDPITSLKVLGAVKGNSFTVKFVKKNGDLRTMTCQYEDTAGSCDTTFTVSTPNGVRSFRLASVVSISIP